MADLRRLRADKYGPAFHVTLKHQGIQAGSESAKSLAAAIRRLRSAKELPLDGDAEIDLWGATRFWAHAFASHLWLYYRPDPTGADEYVELMAVHDHVHEQ